MRSVWKHNLNSAGVQNSVIIGLFKECRDVHFKTDNNLVFFFVEHSRFLFQFFLQHVPVPIKSLCLSPFNVFPLYVCFLICSVFFYSCGLVGRSFLRDPSSFLLALLSLIFFKYSRSKAVGLFFLNKTKLFAFPQNIAQFHFRWPSLKGV